MKHFYIFVLLFLGYSLSYGQAGNSLNFDGTDDFVNIGNVIPDASSYTKEAVVKSNNNAWKNIVTSDPCPFWFAGGKLAAGHGEPFTDVAVDAAAIEGVWTHVAVTYDATSATMKLYIDGVMVDENNSVAAYTAGDIQIGAFNSGYSFVGDMDEVRIWNYARSETEINDHKDCELAGNESGLLAYYKFNQGDVAYDNSAITSLTDTKGNFNGTLMGFELTGSVSNFIGSSSITTDNICSTVGINDLENIEGLVTYPNPTSGIVNIVLENNEAVNLVVFDINGRELHHQNFINNTSVDLSGFLNGIYLLKIKTSIGVTVKQIIKI